MEYTIYEILWMFLIYACMGWCLEVGYCGLNSGKFVNRGFLNGPVCPIYGVGGVLIVLCLTPLEENICLLFIGSVLVTSLIELATGFALEKIYHARWWDYTDQPFNIGGYICLKFSLAWGVAGIFLMKIIHPAVYGIIKVCPRIFGVILLIFFSAVFIADCLVTFVTVNKLSKRMEIMNGIALKIHNISDKLGYHVYEKTVETGKIGAEISSKIDIQGIKEKSEHEREELKEKYEKEIAALKEKYAALAEEKNFFHKRIIKAFPSFKSKRFEDEFEKIKEHIKKR